MSLIGSIFDDGEIYVQSLISRAAEPEVWEKIVGCKDQGGPTVTCPLVYSDDKLNEQNRELVKWQKDGERKAWVIDEVRVNSGWDGAVLPEEHEDVSERLENAKERFLAAESKTPEEKEQWAKAWPFRDR
jgi:hypothetical protein